jgi:hypothetical protein
LGTYEERMAAADRRAAAGDPLATFAMSCAGRTLARELHEIAGMSAPTRAWPLRGGSAAWVRQAEACAPGWLSQLAAEQARES